MAAFLLSGTLIGVSEEPTPLSNAGIVTCDYPSSGENVGKWVSSQAGFSAAVGLQARVSGSGDHRRCLTLWKLHVREKDAKERIFTIAEREDKPDDNEWIQENSFEINGWSKDGQLLLASQIEAQGDWDETTPVIFDFAAGKFWRVGMCPLFKRFIPADCFVVYSAIGFAADDTVIIDAVSTDDDRASGTEPCFPVSRWKLDFRTRTITRLNAETPTSSPR